jgi:hypothetical protein
VNAPGSEWTQANQRLLAAELAWLRHQLEAGDEAVAAIEDERADAAEAMPSPSAIDIVRDLFGLTPFERGILLLCAGAELDARIAAASAAIQPAGAPPHPTFGLALARLPQAHWSAITPVGSLRRWRLVEVDPGMRLVDSALRVDERILHFLAGINVVDSRLRPLLKRRSPPRLMAPAHLRLVDELAAHFSRPDPPAFAALDGNDAEGQQDIAASVAASLGISLLVLSGDDLPAGPVEREQFQVLWEREARLLPALLLLQAGDDSPVKAINAFAERAESSLIVASREPRQPNRPCLSRTVDKPLPVDRKALWIEALADRAARLDGAVDALAAHFELSAQSICLIADAAYADVVDPPRLWAACRGIGRQRLDDLAQRLRPAAGWPDLILPEAQLATLRQIVVHMRQRLRVHEEWGFARLALRGLGVSALFSGESGTGKTLAADVLANELGLDLYRIDLSAVVSKYIGETEKNLRRVFDAAEDSGAVLLFDEADALFGKRSEVKDSHDRYANIEISYLLQRMEAYRGLAILTTNMKGALDRAFLRRLRFVVSFPFPDATQREAIWRRVFPSDLPLKAVDYRKLSRLSLPGGHIRNIAMNAAFLAADAGESVAMAHLLRAAQAESAKFERPLAESETREWI